MVGAAVEEVENAHNLDAVEELFAATFVDSSSVWFSRASEKGANGPVGNAEAIGANPRLPECPQQVSPGTLNYLAPAISGPNTSTACAVHMYSRAARILPSRTSKSQ